MKRDIMGKNMRKKKPLNPQGAGFVEYILWAALALGLAWAVKGFLSNPDNLKSVPLRQDILQR
jgi:hypothetical protein